MTTFLIKTVAPRGPRSVTRETFVVVAPDAIRACEIALSKAHDGAKVTSTERVEECARVHVGG